MQITFLGAAREVTGSCYFIEAGVTRFIVDCGMFQGGREADQKNLEALTFDPSSLDFVLITHAHIDHSGLLPRLVGLGFRGPSFSTSASLDLMEVMLRDSAHIQEHEAERANRPGQGHGHKAQLTIEPLYRTAQVDQTVQHFRAVEYDTEFTPAPSVRVRLRDAGHILGSAIIELWIEDAGRTTKLVFSGDLGQPGRPILCDPTIIQDADVLLVESTYGNRLHKSLQDTEDELVYAIEHTLSTKHVNVSFPAFAVGRTQEILYLLFDLARRGRLSNLNVFIDSPLALAATEITLKHTELLDAETLDLIVQARRAPGPVHVHFIESVDESMALNRIREGAVIISASGMCDAGRIRHHLRHNLGRAECSIVITGFQAQGSLGRRLVDRVPTIRLFREEIRVRADIYTIGGLSAHADQAALLDWLSGFVKCPRQTFVVHGEEETALGFADLIREKLGWNAQVPMRGDTITLV